MGPSVGPPRSGIGEEDVGPLSGVCMLMEAVVVVGVGVVGPGDWKRVLEVRSGLGSVVGVGGEWSPCGVGLGGLSSSDRPEFGVESGNVLVCSLWVYVPPSWVVGM